MKFLNYILVFGLVLSLNSCEFFQLKSKTKNRDIIAKVGDKKLYISDLADLYQPNMSKDDSIKITQNFIENWARNEIILQRAKINLSSTEEAELKDMVRKYEQDLLINSYKAALVSQKLDSVISDEEIAEFHKQNNKIFNLNEDLLRYRMISFQSNDKKASKMKELFKKNDSLSIQELMKGDFLYQSIQLNDSVWIKYTDFLKKYPFAQNTNKETLLNNNQYLEIKEGAISHYLFIKSALKRGEIAPLQFIKEDVSKMILHQKKLKYLQDLENKLIQEAIQNGTYEKY